MQLIADFIGFEVVWEADAPDEQALGCHGFERSHFALLFQGS
jgi:hypothetical protein